MRCVETLRRTSFNLSAAMVPLSFLLFLLSLPLRSCPLSWFPFLTAKATSPPPTTLRPDNMWASIKKMREAHVGSGTVVYEKNFIRINSRRRKAIYWRHAVSLADEKMKKCNRLSQLDYDGAIIASGKLGDWEKCKKMFCYTFESDDESNMAAPQITHASIHGVLLGCVRHSSPAALQFAVDLIKSLSVDNEFPHASLEPYFIVMVQSAYLRLFKRTQNLDYLKYIRLLDSLLESSRDYSLEGQSIVNIDDIGKILRSRETEAASILAEVLNTHSGKSSFEEVFKKIKRFEIVKGGHLTSRNVRRLIEIVPGNRSVKKQ